MFYRLQNNCGIPQSHLAEQESNYGTLFSQFHLIYSGALIDYPHREPDGRTDFAPAPGYNSLLNELNGRGYTAGLRYLTNVEEQPVNKTRRASVALVAAAGATAVLLGFGPPGAVGPRAGAAGEGDNCPTRRATAWSGRSWRPRCRTPKT